MRNQENNCKQTKENTQIVSSAQTMPNTQLSLCYCETVTT